MNVFINVQADIIATGIPPSHYNILHNCLNQTNSSQTSFFCLRFWLKFQNYSKSLGAMDQCCFPGFLVPGVCLLPFLRLCILHHWIGSSYICKAFTSIEKGEKIWYFSIFSSFWAYISNHEIFIIVLSGRKIQLWWWTVSHASLPKSTYILAINFP